LVTSALIGSALRRQHPPAPLLIVKRPFQPTSNVRERVERWVPPTPAWAWAHTLIDRLFGRRQPINLDVEAFEFRGAFATRQLEVELGRPSSSLMREGLFVWFLTYGEVTALRVRLENEPNLTGYRSRVSTADGIGAALFMGNSVVLSGVTNQVGIQEDYFPRVGPGGLDLFTSLQISQQATNNPNHFEPDQPAVFVRTNADLAVRLQIPSRRSVFLLKRDSLGGKSAGLVLELR